MNFLLRNGIFLFTLIFIFSIISVRDNNFYDTNITNIDTPTTFITLAADKTPNCIKNPKISVFMYHYVRGDDPNDIPVIKNLSVLPKRFKEHMNTVRSLADEKKIALMTGENFEKSFLENCFPHENIWIFTADDGWVDTAEKLAPIAEKYRIPFIFGIIAETINHPGFVTDIQVMELDRNPLFTIASHTSHHKDHSTLSDKEEEFEICDSKHTLEALLKKPVNLFMFPLGKIGNNSLKYLEKCGYSLAWSTNYGKDFNWNHPEKYIMNRIFV